MSVTDLTMSYSLTLTAYGVPRGEGTELAGAGSLSPWDAKACKARAGVRGVL